MEINKNSIVSSVCGIQSNIKLFELCNHLSIDDEIDEVVEALNDDEEFELDDWYIGLDDGIILEVRVQDDYGVTKLLENVFNEKYLMMVATRYSYENHNGVDHDKHSIKWHPSGTSEDFVESVIEEHEQVIKKIITKGHYEDEIIEINESNFLSDEEKSQIDKYEDDDENYERLYDANYCHFFIKKSEFDSNKWWLGWSIQQV